MSGLLRRIRRTRPAAAEESRPQQPALSEPQDATPTAEPPGGGVPLAGMRDLPAGLEPEELSSPRPATERRSRLRRRARYLRRVRELLLRDLGGVVYEVHRTAGGDRTHHEGLVQAKAQRLAALDAELHELEARLGGAHPETILREPGIGGVCPACGELHASDAHFCSACGQPLRAGAHGPSAPDQGAEAGAARATGNEAPTLAEPSRREAAPRSERFTGNGHAEDLAAAERRS